MIDTLIQKADEWAEDSAERLNRLLDQQEARIGQIFRASIAGLKDELDLEEIADLIEQGRINDAFERIMIVGQQLGAASSVAFVTAGQSAAEFLANAGLGSVVFDQVNINAVAAMQQNQLRLVREFTDKQRQATAFALTGGVEAGTNPIAQARNFRDSIGLTMRQWQHVASYRAALERVGVDPAAAQNALARALRDGRGDRSVLAAARASRPLAPEKIDWLVGRYAERYVKHRSEVIARTEALRAVNEGNEEAFRQAIASETIDARDLERTWRTRLDGRQRDTHDFLNGQKRQWGEAWQTSNGTIRYPGDPAAPASETIQCRCVILTRIRRN